LKEDNKVIKEFLNLDDFINIFKKVNEIIQENKIELSKLDSVIGDGDHGITIAKGFESAIEKISANKPTNISELLKAVGNTITITIGGVAGPIFGTMFSEMGRKLPNDKVSVDVVDLNEMFSAALEKIMKLGGAKPGEKTMVDALYPAVQCLKESEGKMKNIKEVFKEMALSAKKGAEMTKNMIALKGKSSYSKERSLGYEDAGANTVYLILKGFYEAV